MHIACGAVILFYADTYLLEYSGVLYMFLYPILVSMASLPTSCNNLSMQNIPYNGAGRRPAPHPPLAIIPSPTAIYLYFIQSALYRICVYCVIQEYVAIHEMWKERKSTCSICVGGPGRLPAPFPRSVGGAVGGVDGGPGLAWGF